MTGKPYAVISRNADTLAIHNKWDKRPRSERLFFMACWCGGKVHFCIDAEGYTKAFEPEEPIPDHYEYNKAVEIWPDNRDALRLTAWLTFWLLIRLLHIDCILGAIHQYRLKRRKAKEQTP